MKWLVSRHVARGLVPSARHRMRALIVCLATGAASGPLFPGPLPGYPELLQQAESSAPRLLEGAADVGIAEGMAAQAAALPNPQVSYQSEGFGGNEPFRRSSPRQDTVSVSQVVEIGGKRGSRIAAERAAADAARVSYTQAKLDFAYDLAISYVTAEAEQARAELLVQGEARAEEDLRMAQALVGSGKESDLRLLQAQAAVSAARADAQAARASATTALIRISSLVGASQPYTSMGSSLLGDTSRRALSAEKAPELPTAVLVAQAERDAAARRVEAERRRAISDLTLSIGERNLPGQDAHALVAGVSVALPIFDHNRGAIAARRAELAAADARLAAARLEADADWRSATAMAEAAANRLTAAEETGSAAAEAYRLSRIGYDAGRTSLLELLATRSGLIDAQLLLVDARFARIQAEARIARLSGRIPFGDSNP